MNISESKQKNVLPEAGTPVTTKCCPNVSKYTDGFLVKEHHIKERKNMNGEYCGYVPGSGGDLWWVKHTDDSIGVYMFTEVFDVDFSD